MNPRLKLSRVLVVDDSEDDYLIVRDLLEEVAQLGLDVLWASNYEDASKTLGEEQYDVCLMDYRLGVRTGLELLQELSPNCTTPIILLTGMEDHQIDVAAAKAGASDYLVKNHINGPLLERSIRYAMQRKESEEALVRAQHLAEEAQRLAEEAQRFAQDTVDALPDHLAVLDEQGVIVSVNRPWRAFADANGFVGSSYGVGTSYLAVCDESHSVEGAAIAAGIRAVMAGDKERFCLEYACHSPRAKCWFETRVTRFQSKNPLRILVVHEDVTARKLAEVQLLESQVNLAHAQQIARMGSWELDLSNLADINSNSLRWSDQVFRIFGFEPGQIEVSNENFFRAVHPDDRERISAAVAESIQSGSSYSIDHRIILPDRSERIVLEQSEVIYDPVTGIPLKMVGTLQDITERKQAELSLLESQERLRLATEAAHLGIWDWNVVTNTAVWDAQMCSLYGICEEDFGGTYEAWSCRLHPEDHDRVEGEMREAIAGLKEFHPQFRVVCPNGEVRHIEARAIVQRADDGSAVRVIGVNWDISERKQAEDALRASEARSNAVVQYALDCIITIDDKGRVVEFNPAAEATFGFSRAEAVGQDLNDLIVPPAFHHAHNEGIARFLKTGESRVLNRRIEVPALRKDRREITVELSATAIPHSAPPSFTAYLRDITDRKAAEAELLRMRDELEVRVQLRTAELARTNEALQNEIAEKERAEAETRTRARQQEAVAELGRRALTDLDIDTLLRGATALVVATLDVQIGALLELVSEAEPLRIRAGTGWQGDVTGRTIPNNSRSQAGYCLLTGQPIIVQDLRAETRFEPSPLMVEQGIVSGVTVLVSGFQGPFGTLGAHTTSARRFSQDDVHFLQSMANVLAAALEQRRVESAIRQLNAQLELTNEQLKIENGERQMALRALETLADGLALAKEEADQAREHAEIANRAKSEFLSRMSHELRTPLNAIIGFGQILAMRCRDIEPRQQDNIQQILKAGRHLLNLINEVLDIARIEAGHLSLSPEPLAIGPLVEEILGLVQPLALDRDITLVNEVIRKDAALYVLADQQRLKQVLLNLVSNAVKYNCDGGQVVVAADISDRTPFKQGELRCVGSLRIMIRDKGPGLTQQEMENLFVPFERLSAARSQIEGTGIGLSLCKLLTEAMNGRIGVESRVGEGSTFWLELPLMEEPLHLKGLTDLAFSSGMDNVRLLLSPTAPTFSGSSTILHIEDNLSNVHLIEGVLLDFNPNFRLLTAMQGRLGLDLAAQHMPHLILLDVNLPDIMGDVVLRRLKANSLTNHIPVIVLSADATPRQIDSLLNAGAAHYLTKPLDVAQFLDILAETLQKSIS